MADRISQTERSELMRSVRQKNTEPELRVRRLLHFLGYRFRLHGNALPGTPDIVFPSRKKVIFVHGCFWHRHEGCKKASMPKSRTQFWKSKFTANVERDKRKLSDLDRLGWKSILVWECETEETKDLSKKLKTFLGD